MAVSFIEDAQVGRTANGGYNVAPENIVVRPNLSGRSEESDISELAAEIEKRGQLIPATATKDDNNWPVLLAGHRRLRAIVELNKTRSEDKKLKLLFNYVKVADDEAGLDFTVAENRNRTEVNPLDDFFNIQIYSKMFNRSVEEIAYKYFPGAQGSPEKTKKAVAWVKGRLQLGELSVEAQEELRQGKLSTTAAIQMADLPRVAQNELVQKSIKEGKSKIKVKDVQEAVAAKKPKRGIDPDILIERAIKRDALKDRIADLEELAEFGAQLANEVYSSRRDEVTLKELSAEYIRFCRNSNVPIPAEVDSKLSQ